MVDKCFLDMKMLLFNSIIVIGYDSVTDRQWCKVFVVRRLKSHFFYSELLIVNLCSVVSVVFQIVWQCSAQCSVNVTRKICQIVNLVLILFGVLLQHNKLIVSIHLFIWLLVVFCCGSFFFADDYIYILYSSTYLMLKHMLPCWCASFQETFL